MDQQNWQNRKLWIKTFSGYIGVEAVIWFYKKSKLNEKLNEHIGSDLF